MLTCCCEISVLTINSYIHPFDKDSIHSLIQQLHQSLIRSIAAASISSFNRPVIHTNMSDSRQAGNRQDATVDPEWARGLTTQFQSLLQNKRLNNALDPRSRQPSPSPDSRSFRPQSANPPMPQSPLHRPVSSSSSHHTSRRHKTNSPIPTQPHETDLASKKFRSLLLTLSETPIKYENPGLLDEALKALPLNRIYGEAEEESQVFAAVAESSGDGRRAEWGYQDCVIRALLRYVACPKYYTSF